MSSNYSTRKPEAKAGAGGFAREIRFEETCGKVVGYTRTVVGDSHVNTLWAAFYADSDGPFSIVEDFDRIENQIGNDLQDFASEDSGESRTTKPTFDGDAVPNELIGV